MKSSLAAFALTALTGCAPMPDIQEPPSVSPDAALRARAALVAGDPALAEDAPPSEWWQLFDDASLSALQAEAAGSNFDIQAALARVEESRARLGTALAARRPYLSVDGGYARSALSEHSPMAMLGAPTFATDNWSLGAQAGWELDLWGRLRQLADSAEARLEESEFGMAAARVSVAGEVARVYLLLRGTQAQEAIAGENHRAAGELRRLAESRERNGVATRFETAASRAELAGVEARLAQLRHQREVLMNALALLLGKPPRELEDRLAAAPPLGGRAPLDGPCRGCSAVAAALPPMPRRLPIGVPSDLARRRPDILRAEAALRAAVADIGAARADFYPRVSLTGNLGVQSFEFSDLASWSSRRYSVGPILYLPVFQGGRLESQLALSEARHRLAAIAYQQTVLRAWHEVDDALGAYVTEMERNERLRFALAQNETAFEVARRAYEEGSADFVAVLLARRALLAGEASLAECATASALAVVALYRALGGGWSPVLASAASGGDAAKEGAP